MFVVPNLGSEPLRPKSAVRFVPPRIGWTTPQPLDSGSDFSVLNRGARFVH